MAFNGLHVVCGFTGGAGENGNLTPLIRHIKWSQTLPSAGETEQAAPEGGQVNGDPIFRVIASLPVFVAVGPDPDPVNGPRMYIPAGETIDTFVEPGDKLAWVAA
jgi:hypothetical protein